MDTLAGTRTIIWFHDVEALASILSLVAGGVAGEIFLENRARLADNGRPHFTAPTTSRVQHPEPDYGYWGSSVDRRGRAPQHRARRNSLPIRNTSASPSNSKLLPSF